MLPIDARISQICCLTLFLILGVATRDWTLQITNVSMTLLTCVVVQAGLSLWSTYSQKPHAVSISQFPEAASQLSASELPEAALSATALPESEFSDNRFAQQALECIRQGLPSALITGLGLSLLLRADQVTTLMLASTAAIASKFLLRFNSKHIFNPANFGIIMALSLTQDAWVSPGQWGESGWYALLFIGTGGLVLKSVGRWDTTLSFLATYIGLEAMRNLWLGWTWDVWAHRLISGSLLLFAFFMITDPRTIPNAGWGRVVWAVTIALLTFGLRNLFFVPTAVFWALFACAPLSLVIDWLLPADRFRWHQPPKLS